MWAVFYFVVGTITKFFFLSKVGSTKLYNIIIFIVRKKVARLETSFFSKAKLVHIIYK